MGSDRSGFNLFLFTLYPISKERMRKFLIILCLPALILSCGEDEVTPNPVNPDPVIPAKPKVQTPDFNADSAYKYVQEQLAFGPRVPNTAAHDSCAEYLKDKFLSFGLDLLVQEGEVTAYTNSVLKIQNIIGRFHKERKNRIMLCAHWDTRHIADRDPDNPKGAIDGANDGASGVAVILEMARQIAASDPKIGVDFILFDAEDYGSPQLQPGMMAHSQLNDTWCLGSQYWAKNPPIPGYKPQFGILLDMVGAENATFPKELISLQHAGPYVHAIWDRARELGYQNYFIPRAIGGITDDHKYVNEIAGIPTLDIIHYRPGAGDFGMFHHTHGDNIGIINKETLRVVGHVCLDVIYQGL